MPLNETGRDTIEFAKDYSFEIDLFLGSPDLPSASAGVRMMNQRLWASGENVYTFFKAGEAFIDLPSRYADAEDVPHDSLQKSRIEGPIIYGVVDAFRWVRSSKLATFGIHLSEVVLTDQMPQLYLLDYNDQLKKLASPFAKQIHNAFIPVQAIEEHTRPYGSLHSHIPITTEDGEVHTLVRPTLPLQIPDDIQ